MDLSPEPNQQEIRPHCYYDLIVMGASAGGIQAVSQILAGLPVDFPAAIIVVIHLYPLHKSHLYKILARNTPMEVRPAQEGEPIRAGQVYVALPDQHTLVSPQRTIALSAGDRVNYVRPAIDRLFDTAAEVYHHRLIAVVLTGMGHDGSAGVRSVKGNGGYVIVQTSESAKYQGMPSSAVLTGDVDRVIAIDQISTTLTRLVYTGAAE